MNHLECETCGALLEVGQAQRTTTCAYCASPAVIERPATPERPNPRFVVAFVVPPERARRAAQRWIGRALLAPRAFRRAVVDDRSVRGVYVPAYLYTAAAYSQYRAAIGEYYAAEEKSAAVDDQGNKVTRTRTVTRTEWRPLSGEHAVYVSDLVVPASRGLPVAELRRIEPFDLRALRRFSPGLISGWVAEEPSFSPQQCLLLARDEARSRVRARLAAFLPGDEHRLVRQSTELHAENLELLLLPVWLMPVRYSARRPAVRLLVNGQTGRVWGKAPLSLVKVAALALVIAALASLVMYLFHAS